MTFYALYMICVFLLTRGGLGTSVGGVNHVPDVSRLFESRVDATRFHFSSVS